jgi:hypothetical protein
MLSLIFLTIAPNSARCVNEVIMMCPPGVITIPPPNTTCHLTEAVISKTELQSALGANGVQIIAKAFPDFDPADTLEIHRQPAFLLMGF